MSSVSETQHALYMFTRKFNKYKHQAYLNLETFSDGLPFAQMLSSISQFTLTIKQLQDPAEKWTQKLANLKKLLSKMQNYVYVQSQKQLKINDLQLVQIAKNASQQEILKFFEVVIAVLMQTSQKQQYIQTIMDLDQKSQQALVIVVQNAMEYRISEHNKSQNKSNKHFVEKIQILQNENHVLSEQINQLCLQNQTLLKQNKQLKEKLLHCQEEIQKTKNIHMEVYMSSKNQDQKQNSLIQTLKNKMITMSRDHEIQLTKSNEQIYQLKAKIIHSKQIQQELLQKIKLFQTKMKNQDQDIQLERKRQQKIFQQKQAKIRKLQYELQISKNKIRELTQDIELNDLNLRMQLQKKEVRFKQLQKQVKNRLIQPPSQMGAKKFSVDESNTSSHREQHLQELEFLKIQVQKLRTSNRQLERQNLKMKKKIDKIQILENQKKKLEKVILDVSKCRDSEIQMLIVSLYDLRNQNVRMHEIITQLKYRQESKYE